MWVKKIVNCVILRFQEASSYGKRMPAVQPVGNCCSSANTKAATRTALQGHNWSRTRTYADVASAVGGATQSNKRKKSKGVAGRPPPITEEYKVAWKKVAPMFDVHKTPSDFMNDRPGPTNTLPLKLTVNFVLPSRTEMSAKEVDMVIVPAASGMMGLLPGHVPTIAQLRPGLLSVHDGTEVKKYFVSSGFAIVHANSVADLLLVEAVTMDKLDIEEARKGLAEYTQKQDTATTELAKAEAQIAIEVYGALVTTMTTA